MAIIVLSDTPQTLLNNIRKQIDEDKIRTWIYDKDGDFTHSAPQWKYSAWLHPKIGSDKLTLTTIPPKGAPISVEVYAIYHGRFIEMLLGHFDKQFSSAYATALPERGDVVG